MDVVCLGELLVDLVSPAVDASLAQATSFAKAPGGAPANVAAAVARLGHQAAFIGCVGDDAFGRFLAETLRAEGVELAGLRFDGAARTTLAFIATHGDGRKDILFYRNPGADSQLRPQDLPTDLLRSTRIFHFCSVSLSCEPIRSATLAAAAQARSAGALVSFDPNWRAPLWANEDDGRREIRSALQLADIVKVADEELELVTGTTDVEAALDGLLTGGAQLAVVTLGRAGARAATAAARVTVPGYAVATVDTLGAGDAFVAGLLSALLSRPAGDLLLNETELLAALRRANAAGALTTTKLGVIPALPTPGQLEVFLEKRP